MKKITALFIALIFATQAWAANGAKKNADLKIAVVNSHMLIEHSKAFGHIRKQIEDKGKSFNTNAKKDEEKLKKEFEELETKSRAMSKDAYEQKRQELSQKAQEFNTRAYNDRTLIDNAFSKAVASLQDKAREVLEKKVKEEGYDLVLNNTSLLFSDDRYDITKELLTKLNKVAPTVEVSFKK
jgi:outer membrane protein